MLLTDKEALEKANRIIKESGENAKIEDFFFFVIMFFLKAKKLLTLRD